MPKNASQNKELTAEVIVKDSSGWGGDRVRYTLVINGVMGTPAKFDHPLFCTYEDRVFMALSDYWEGSTPIESEKLYELTPVKVKNDTIAFH